MIELGQQVRVRNGMREGEDGLVMDFETCSRKTAAGWQACSFLYVQFFSNGAIGMYEEDALELMAPPQPHALSVAAGN
jgi:hypothetical protein